MFYSKKFNKIKNIRHCFFSRKNGFSKGLYTSLNCGLGSNDDHENVIKNLGHVSRKLETDPKNLVIMNQSHSNKVIVVDEQNKKCKRFDSDALVTRLKGFVLSVLTADCVPVILYDKKNEIIGCIHAGWKGCISGIIENTLNKFYQIGSDNNLMACIGPCIGRKSYEVETDLFKKFIQNSRKNSVFFVKKNNDKYLFNIRAFVQSKLQELGVEDIDNIDLDTFQDPINFYSYRRSKKMKDPDYGRCISTICLKT
jgi:YfiH family protein